MVDAVDPIAGLPLVDPLAIPDGPSQINALAKAVSTKLVLVYKNEAARQQALPYPTPGMLTFLESDSTYYVYRNGGWESIWPIRDSGWIKVGDPGAAQYQTGWTGHQTGVWSGVHYRKRDGVVTVTGAAAKAQYGQESIFALPEGFRPSFNVMGMGSPSGQFNLAAVYADGGWVRTTSSGGTYYALHVSFPI